MIATNANKIIQLRKNGYRPDEMIIISLVGKLDELNHVVYADTKTDYDWSWCRGLDICIFASSGVKWTKTMNSIARVKTHFLAVWDIDRHEGADFVYLPNHESVCKPQSLWQWHVIPNIWIPMQNRIFSGEICN